MLNELYFELAPQKELRETDLGDTVVETRLCCATLSCSAHKPACKRATARCPGAINKNLRPGSMRAAQLGTMYSSIPLSHSSPFIFRPGYTKCNVGAMSRAPIIPETITPRAVAVCDAVNRCGVSSSSSASIFEVVRDSEILGSDRPKKCAKMRPNWRNNGHGGLAFTALGLALGSSQLHLSRCDLVSRFQPVSSSEATPVLRPRCIERSLKRAGE